MPTNRKTLRRRSKKRLNTKKGGAFFRNKIDKDIYTVLCYYINKLVFDTIDLWVLNNERVPVINTSSLNTNFKSTPSNISTEDIFSYYAPPVRGGARIDKSDKQVEYMVGFVNEVFPHIINEYIRKYSEDIENQVREQLLANTALHTDLNRNSYIASLINKMIDVPYFCPDLSNPFETVMRLRITYSQQQELERYAYKKLYEILASPNVIRIITETVAKKVLMYTTLPPRTDLITRPTTFFADDNLVVREREIDLLTAKDNKKHASTEEKITAASKEIVDAARNFALAAFKVRNFPLMHTALNELLTELNGEHSTLYDMSLNLKTALEHSNGSNISNTLLNDALYNFIYRAA